DGPQHRTARREAKQPHGSLHRKTPVQPSDERRRIHLAGAPPRLLMRVLLALVLTAATCAGQSYSHRGFLENRATFYPQTAANDRARAIGESLFRYEGFLQPSSAFQL